MVAYLDRELRYRYANRPYTAFYAPGTESLEGRALSEVLGSEAWQAVKERVQRAVAGEHVTFRRRHRRADGKKRDTEVTLVPHHDTAGELQGFYSMILDITDRRRAEKALRLRERALESSVNGVMITGTAAEDYALVYVNPAFERITGYSAAEVLGRNPRFLRGEHTPAAQFKALGTALSDEREGSVQVCNYRKDGSLFWNELYIAPVKDDQGRVTHYIGISTDVTERVRHLEQLERHAHYDPLTGLPNRNLLRDRLQQAIAQANRTAKPAAVLYIDLDHLKRINDSLGHALGDEVIAELGKRIARTLRVGDTVARMGGDEFVAVLALKREADAARVAEKLREALAAPLKLGAHEFVLSASVGAAIYPKDGKDAETLLRNADAALYRAKGEGRDCLRFFTAEMNARVLEQVQLEGKLRRALDGREFQLHYQPIVDLATKQVVGVEALIRWRTADGQMVAPDHFIPMAEDSGLIMPIGRWVLQAAALHSRKLNRGGTPLYVSVNLSARQFRDPTLVQSVRETLLSSRADGAQMQIEITETTVMSDAEEAVQTLRDLKDLGLRISVDDFGTGYSSLSYLKRFPLDTLKIDRGFVRDLATDPDDLTISRTVIDLAHGLGLGVIAEGVETARQAEILAGHGCDAAQGFLYGRPAPAH